MHINQRKYYQFKLIITLHNYTYALIGSIRLIIEFASLILLISNGPLLLCNHPLLPKNYQGINSVSYL